MLNQKYFNINLKIKAFIVKYTAADLSMYK